MALTIYNPIRDVCEAALSVFPDLDCHVSFADFPDGGPRGTTEWAENGDGTAIVQVDVRLPMAGVVEVLAHELAHVAAGLDAEHGPEWQDAFERIRVAYCERIESQDESLDEVVSAMEASSSQCQSSCSPP